MIEAIACSAQCSRFVENSISEVVDDGITGEIN